MPTNPYQQGPRQLSSREWEQIFQGLPDGLIVTDRHFNVLFVNRAFCELSAKEASSVVGNKCYDIFPGAFCHTPDCPLAQIRSGGERLVYEKDARCKNGRHAPWLVATIAFDDAEGNFAGIVERISDASAFKQMQQDLYHSHERLRKNMGAIIQAMSMTIEKRDPYTAGHQRRVAKLCRAVATQLGFSWDRIQGLRMAAAIHDLGKINTPAGILNKPGPISEHELAIIQMHPCTAFDILKGIQFPWPLAEIIYQHHERLDGSGYPRQLKGDEILLEARILAVADVVESMAFFRPYRPAMGLQAAMEEIQNHKGVLYDAKVVDACVALITEKGFDFKTKSWQHAADVDEMPGVHSSLFEE